MSWSLVRPFFQTALETNSHTEWPDGFGLENIPANLLDRAYHISLGPISGDRQNHADQESTITVTVSTFYKGYRYPQEAIDVAVQETEAIVKSCVNVAARTTTPGILNVLFDNAEIDPIGETNDNAIVVTATYSVRVILQVCD